MSGALVGRFFSQREIAFFCAVLFTSLTLASYAAGGGQSTLAEANPVSISDYVQCPDFQKGDIKHKGEAKAAAGKLDFSLFKTTGFKGAYTSSSECSDTAPWLTNIEYSAGTSFQNPFASVVWAASGINPDSTVPKACFDGAGNKFGDSKATKADVCAGFETAVVGTGTKSKVVAMYRGNVLTSGTSPNGYSSSMDIRAGFSDISGPNATLSPVLQINAFDAQKALGTIGIGPNNRTQNPIYPIAVIVACKSGNTPECEYIQAAATCGATSYYAQYDGTSVPRGIFINTTRTETYPPDPANPDSFKDSVTPKTDPRDIQAGSGITGRPIDYSAGKAALGPRIWGAITPPSGIEPTPGKIAARNSIIREKLDGGYYFVRVLTFNAVEAIPPQFSFGEINIDTREDEFTRLVDWASGVYIGYAGALCDQTYKNDFPPPADEPTGGPSECPQSVQPKDFWCTLTNTQAGANKTNIEWRGTAGGTVSGPFTYHWTGSGNPALSATTNSPINKIEKSYPDGGEQYANLKVKTADGCYVAECTSKTAVPQPLTVSCTGTPNDTPFNPDSEIGWEAFPKGGSGNYSYQWSGNTGTASADELKGGAFKTSYTSAGDKTAKVIVTDNLVSGPAKETQCTVKLRTGAGFSGYCSADEPTKEVGKQVTWTAYGCPAGKTCTYSWSATGCTTPADCVSPSGKDSISGAAVAAKKTYSTVGKKNASVAVAVDGITENFTCEVTITAPTIQEPSCSFDPAPPAARSIKTGETATFILSYFPASAPNPTVTYKDGTAQKQCRVKGCDKGECEVTCPLSGAFASVGEFPVSATVTNAGKSAKCDAIVKVGQRSVGAEPECHISNVLPANHIIDSGDSLKFDIVHSNFKNVPQITLQCSDSASPYMNTACTTINGITSCDAKCENYLNTSTASQSHKIVATVKDVPNNRTEICETGVTVKPGGGGPQPKCAIQRTSPIGNPKSGDEVEFTITAQDFSPEANALLGYKCDSITSSPAPSTPGQTKSPFTFKCKYTNGTATAQKFTAVAKATNGTITSPECSTDVTIEPGVSTLSCPIGYSCELESSCQPPNLQGGQGNCKLTPKEICCKAVAVVNPFPVQGNIVSVAIDATKPVYNKSRNNEEIELEIRTHRFVTDPVDELGNKIPMVKIRAIREKGSAKTLDGTGAIAANPDYLIPIPFDEDRPSGAPPYRIIINNTALRGYETGAYTFTATIVHRYPGETVTIDNTAADYARIEETVISVPEIPPIFIIFIAFLAIGLARMRK